MYAENMFQIFAWITGDAYWVVVQCFRRSWFSHCVTIALTLWLRSSCNIHKHLCLFSPLNFTLYDDYATGRKKTAGRPGQQTNQMSNLYIMDTWTCHYTMTSAMTSVMTCGTDNQLQTTQHHWDAGSLSLSHSFSFHARFSSFYIPSLIRSA